MRIGSLLAVSLALTPACHTRGGVVTPAPESGTVTRDVSVVDGAGRSTPLDALRRDVTVVALWAVWCGSCRDHLPVIERLATHYAADTDVAILAVDVDDADLSARAAAHIASAAPRLASYFAPAAETSLAPLLGKGIDGKPSVAVPMVLVLDRADHLHAVTSAPGSDPSNREELDALIRLVELARANALPPAAPRASPGYSLEIRTGADGLRVSVIGTPNFPDEVIDSMLEFVWPLGVSVAPDARERLSKEFAAGVRVFEFPDAVAPSTASPGD